MLCSFENSSPGKARTAAPIERGTLKGKDGSIRQSGSRKCSCAGRKGQQRKRERERWEFRDKVPDSPADRVSGELGASLPSKSPGGRQGSQSPWSMWLCHLAGEAVAEEVIQNPDAEVGLWGEGPGGI